MRDVLPSKLFMPITLKIPLFWQVLEVSLRPSCTPRCVPVRS